jgi:UPF0716 protein FxsA
VFKYLLLAILVVPFLELYLLLAIGREVGLLPTVAMLLLTAMVGTWVARREGGRVMRSWRDSMARGQVPEEGILGGALVMLGGALLVVPGVITDVVGLFLLLPPTRRLVAARVRKSLERKVREGSVHVTTVGFGGFGGFGGSRGDGPFPGGMFPEAPSLSRQDEPGAKFTEGPSRQEQGEVDAEPSSRPSRSSQGEVDAEFTEDEPRH